MAITDILFVVLSILIVGSVLYILFSSNLLRILFAFALVTIGLAGIYVLLHAELMAVIQLMIYAGGIVVIMVFGIMLTKEISAKGVRTGSHQIFPAVVVFTVLCGTGAYMILNSTLAWNNSFERLNTVEQAGKLFLTDHLLAFELIAFVLLVVLVGASYIAHIAKKENK